MACHAKTGPHWGPVLKCFAQVANTASSAALGPYFLPLT